MKWLSNQVEELREWKSGERRGEEGEEEEDSEVDTVAIYKQILEILRPGETVLKVVPPPHPHPHPPPPPPPPPPSPSPLPAPLPASYCFTE